MQDRSRFWWCQEKGRSVKDKTGQGIGAQRVGHELEAGARGEAAPVVVALQREGARVDGDEGRRARGVHAHARALCVPRTNGEDV